MVLAKVTPPTVCTSQWSCFCGGAGVGAGVPVGSGGFAFIVFSIMCVCFICSSRRAWLTMSRLTRSLFGPEPDTCSSRRAPVRPCLGVECPASRRAHGRKVVTKVSWLFSAEYSEPKAGDFPDEPSTTFAINRSALCFLTRDQIVFMRRSGAAGTSVAKVVLGEGGRSE